MAGEAGPGPEAAAKKLLGSSESWTCKNSHGWANTGISAIRPESEHVSEPGNIRVWGLRAFGGRF